MLRSLVAGTALALIASSALAQDAAKAPPVLLDQQLQEAQTQVYAAEAQRNLLIAKKLQAANVEASQQAAATAAWWNAWWLGMFPAATPTPAASAAPHK